MPADLHLGPLTTTFTPPPDCSSITISFASSASTYVPWVYPRLFSYIASTCFPPLYPLGNAALTTIYGVYGYHDEHVYFSPGICPSGWNKNVIGSPTTGSAAETTAVCCEPGFTVAYADAVDGGSSSTYCATNLKRTVVTTVAYTGDGARYGSTETFTYSGNNIAAPGLWIRYKSRDFPASITMMTSTTPKSSPTPTGLGAEPACALSCLTSALNAANCAVLDPACQCGSAIQTAITPCIQSACSPSDISIAASVGSAFCSSYSLTSGSSSTHLTIITSPSIITSSRSSHTSSSSSSSSSTSSSLLPANNSTSTSGLSTPAKFGIGIGVPIAALIAAVSLFAFFFLRKRRGGNYNSTSSTAAYRSGDTGPGPDVEVRSEMGYQYRPANVVDEGAVGGGNSGFGMRGGGLGESVDGLSSTRSPGLESEVEANGGGEEEVRTERGGPRRMASVPML